MSLHNEIMNIPVEQSKLSKCVSGFTTEALAYKTGHRDARHDAAELSLKYDALIEQLSDHFGSGIVDMFKRKVGL